MAVYLLRHGQTEWTISGRHTGRTDVPLTPEGERRARAAGKLLRTLRGDDAAPPAIVLSSPRRRALHTAELAGLTVTEITEDVAEWDYGDYEGLTTPEIREHVPGWRVWSHPTPNGESPEDVGRRATEVVARLRAAAGDAVVVGHGHFSRVLIATWITQPAGFGVHFGLEPGGIAVLGDERGAPQVVRLNLPPIET